MPPPPRGGHYSGDVVSLVVDLYLRTSASLRGVAAALGVLARHRQSGPAVPSPTAVRDWVLRLGCHALVRPLPAGTPWRWVIDHTGGIGPQKLVVIAGCPMAEIPFGERALSPADRRVVALVPMGKSDAWRVAAELETAVRRTGAPRLIVSDQGTDLVGGIKLFRGRHPGTAAAGDAAHYGANGLENRWERDPRWAEMLRRFAHGNHGMRQTADAVVLSPTPRGKSRFMNVGPLLRFAGRVLSLLNRAPPDEKIVRRYGWLAEYADAVAGWREQHALVVTTIRRVRLHGLNAQTLGELEREWGPENTRLGTVMTRGHLRVYVRNTVKIARPGETLAGSSEVLESAFGKLKSKTGADGTGELTGMALALGAILGRPAGEAIRAARDAVPQKKAAGMIRRLFGATVGRRRRKLFADAKA